MDLRRLELLWHLSRAGSMREVADELGITTSTVSQQIAALAREAGTDLIEPVGRGVRLTPAGRRLAGHAVTILAAVEAARVDLDPAAEPAGTLRIAGFATAVRRSLMPLVADLSGSHPDVRLRIHEHEPDEALGLLARDKIDLALTYDYDLAPQTMDEAFDVTPLWSAAWGLGVPRTIVATAATTTDAPAGSAAAVFARFRDAEWIVNSRNTADETVVRTLASVSGFTPQVTHRADSLELVQDLIVAGLGVGLLPLDQPTRSAVMVLPLRDPAVNLRAYAVARHGRTAWPPLALVLDAMQR